MVELLLTGDPGELLSIGVTDWISNNPIIAAILFGLLALFFFLYLLARRVVVEFKKGLRGN